MAALPYRNEPDGSVSVLLITSRETRRWVIPKGNPIRGLEAHQAAAHEAFEEAGISGIACPTPIGSYHYDKRRAGGAIRRATVTVFPLAVVSQFDEWPEQGQRDTRWFTTAEAANAVDETELKAIIGSFREPPKTAGIADRAISWARERGGAKIPVLRWFQTLMPQQGSFFDLFDAHAATLVAGADALARLLQGDAEMADQSRVLADKTREASDIARQVTLDVRRSFVTPFDRSAITGLIGAMDNAIDQMNRTARAITLFDVTTFAPEMRDMSGIIVETARITAEAVPLLRALGDTSGRLHTLTERVIRIESHADEIRDAGLKSLFKQHGRDRPMTFFIGYEIYGHLEKVVDCFEDVANEIQGLVIDHA